MASGPLPSAYWLKMRRTISASPSLIVRRPRSSLACLRSGLAFRHGAQQIGIEHDKIIDLIAACRLPPLLGCDQFDERGTLEPEDELFEQAVDAAASQQFGR